MEEKSKKKRGGNLLNDLDRCSGEAKLYVQVILKAMTDLKYFNSKWKDPQVLPFFLFLEEDDPYKFKDYKPYKSKIGRSESHFLTAIDYIFAPDLSTLDNIIWHLEHIVKDDCHEFMYSKIQERALIALSEKPEVYEYVINKYKNNILESVLKNLSRDKLLRET
jgi:hypothetical protein